MIMKLCICIEKVIKFFLTYYWPSICAPQVIQQIFTLYSSLVNAQCIISISNYPKARWFEPIFLVDQHRMEAHILNPSHNYTYAFSSQSLRFRGILGNWNTLCIHFQHKGWGLSHGNYFFPPLTFKWWSHKIRMSIS